MASGPLVVIPSCGLHDILRIPVLTAPQSKSVISSELWNNIVQNLYMAYNSFRNIINIISYMNAEYLSNEMERIGYNLYFPMPYAFMPLLHAEPGKPLTAKDFNDLVNALEEVYEILGEPLPYPISPAFGDAIVKSETFKKIVYDVNFLRKDALKSILLVSKYGFELSNLPSNFAGQNVLVCCIPNTTTMSGFITIENLFVAYVYEELIIAGSVAINTMIVQSITPPEVIAGGGPYGGIDAEIVQSSYEKTLEITDTASIQNLIIGEIIGKGKLILSGNVFVQNLTVNNCEPNSIIIQDYAIVNNLYGMASQCISTSI